MCIDVAVGKHLVIVELEGELIDEFLLQVGVTHGDIERVGILAQGLYLRDRWLLRAALVEELKIALLADLIVERGTREQVHVVVPVRTVAIEQVGLQIAGVRYVAAKVEVHLFVDKLEVKASRIRQNVVLIVRAVVFVQRVEAGGALRGIVRQVLRITVVNSDTVVQLQVGNL